MKYIGIDIGGSNIKGVLREKNNILKSLTKKTNANTSKEKILVSIIDMILKLKQNFQIEGIGLGAPGIIERGNLVKLANIPHLNNTNIKKILQDKFEVKVKVVNDAKLNYYALHDESIEKNYAILTLGTGLGTCLVLNNQLYPKNSSNEFAHTYFTKGKHLEEFVSKRFLLKEAKKFGINTNSVKEIKKNLKAKEIFELYGKNLGIAISNLHQTLNLEKIYLAGGMTKSSNLFISQTKKSFKEHSFIKPCEIRVIKKRYPTGAYGASKLFAN